MDRIKCVVVGDGTVGKTCMLISYTTNKFPEEYVPTVFDNYISSVSVNGKTMNLDLWDTAGQEDYERLRLLSYTQTDIVLLCFAIDNPISLYNIKDKWWPEIKHHCRDVPYILVGLKSDLREDRNTIIELRKNRQEPISSEDGTQMCTVINGYKYIECSSKTKEGLKQIFDEAIICVLTNRAKPPARKWSCLIL